MAEKIDIVQRELAARELARRKLVAFIMRMYPGYKTGWFHKDLAERLEEFYAAVLREESPRLILAVPPRHGKSLMASQYFPAWALGKKPDLEVIACSYSLSLASTFSRRVRETIDSAEYQALFRTRLATDERSIESWRTTGRGGYVAAGVGGPITGRGAHILVIDDPVKNAEEAESEADREAKKAWYQSTAYTRLAPGGGVIVIQCMTGDTPVTMADGTYKRLDAVRPGDMVKAYKDGAVVDRRVLNWTPQGEDDVYEIRTGNAVVRANARHPFLLQSRSGRREWVRTAELLDRPMQDRRVVMSSLMEWDKPATLTKEEAWLLGYMFGDGWLTVRDTTQGVKGSEKRYPRRGIVTCVALSSNEAENAKVAEHFQEIFGLIPKVTRYGYRRTEKQCVGKAFQKWGLIGRASTKRLPSYLFSEPLEIRRSFLEGYNAADGAVVKTRSNYRWTHGSCNEDLIRDVRHLARSVGYRPTNIHVYESIQQAPNSPEPTFSKNVSVSWTVDRSTEPFTSKSAVRSVKHVGREMVYDIEVEDAECFIADGMVSHNTRWHVDDLAGWLEAQSTSGEGDAFEVVKYPMVADEDELYRRRGETLHPDRYDMDSATRIKKAVGPRVWNALYQQNPVPDTGSYFTNEMFHYYDDRPRRLRVYAAFDLAVSKAERADFTVGIVVGLDKNQDIYILDIVRGRWDANEIVDQLIKVHKIYKPDAIGLEKGTIQLALKPFMDKRLREEDIFDIHLKLLSPGKRDKEARGRNIQGRMKQGRVFWPRQASWLEHAQREMLQFPLGTHDDVPDAMAYIGLMMQDMATPPTPKRDKLRSWREDLEKFMSDSGTVKSYMGA